MQSRLFAYLVSCLLSEEAVPSSLSAKAFFWSTPLIYKSTRVSHAMFVTLQALCQTGVILLHELCQPACAQARCMRKFVLQTYLTGNDIKHGVTGDFRFAQCGL